MIEEEEEARGEELRVEDKVLESLGIIREEGWLSKAASSGVVKEGPLLDT